LIKKPGKTLNRNSKLWRHDPSLLRNGGY